MKRKNVYYEPFITSWPFPLSLKDITECFKVKKQEKSEEIKSEKEYAMKQIYNQIIKATLL